MGPQGLQGPQGEIGMTGAPPKGDTGGRPQITRSKVRQE